MAKHLHIVGVVQGVGYRAAFARKADALNLSGWVRNRIDGSVEAVISGTTDMVDRMIDWARQGPPGAQVRAVSVSDVADPDTADGQVAILPTE